MTPDNEMPIVLLDAVQSLNYVAPVTPPFSQSGTLIDLHNGTITTPGLHVDGATGDVRIIGDITARSFIMPGLSVERPDVALESGTLDDFDWLSYNTYYTGLSARDANGAGIVAWTRPEPFSAQPYTIELRSYNAAEDAIGSTVIQHDYIATGFRTEKPGAFIGTVMRPTGSTWGELQLINLELTGYVNICPPGTIIQGVWTSAPPGFALLNGQTLVNAQTLHTGLWAVAPVAWRSGANLVLPNLNNRVLLQGATPGQLAGSNTHTLTAANLPAHAHTINHAHAEAGRVNGHIAGRYLQRKGGSGPDWDVQPTGLTRWESITNPATSTFSGNSGNGPGTAAAVTHTPAHMTVRMAIKL